MRVRLWAALASALTAALGLIVLLGLLLTPDVADDEGALSADIIRQFNDLADLLLQLATITIALTIFIGILNLVAVHLGRLRRRANGLIYSVVLLVSFGVVVVSYVVDREASIIILDTVQFSVESALAGLLFFALVYGAYRALHHAVTWGRVLFVAVIVLILLAALPVDNADALHPVRDWLLDVPVSAGVRGLLLGIALGTVVTGVRVLIGVDRSYRE
ncbi:MAG: hypothetical protein EA396_12105 [Anaerolineaceae bacterium]|nr:MAG: hypothetical protein EA396_12105 [Anaerolineaceae bacterium]